MTKSRPRFEIAQAIFGTWAAVALAATMCASVALADPPADREMRNFVAARTARPAPEGPFADESGAERRLSEFRGRVLLVNFWAAWCPACLAELPRLDRLQAELGDADFTVLALAQQSGDVAAVAGFLRRRGIRHLAPFVDADRRLGLAFGQAYYPTSVLIDRGGHVVGRIVGPAEWESPEAIALIHHVMQEGGARAATEPR